MSVGFINRLAGPYIGNDSKQRTFSFGFLIFEASDVFVSVADAENAAARTLQQGTDYTVSMNADQNATPGGTITLTSVDGLANGAVLAIGSDVAYTQTLNLTNYTRFPPERISKELDRIVVQIQQLVEKNRRTLTVPVTSTKTPEQVMTEILDVAAHAETYASQAKESAESAALSAQKAQDLLDSEIAEAVEAAVGDVAEAGAEQVAAVENVGDAQAERLQNITEDTLVGYGVGGREETWTLTQDVSSGSTLTLPNSMTYIVGRHHLRISWNGLVLFEGENFSESGTQDVASAVFMTLFDMKAGDVLNALTVPLGRGDLGNVESQVSALSDSVAELSRKAAFHDANL